MPAMITATSTGAGTMGEFQRAAAAARFLLVWCPANNAKKFRMDFTARQGARRSHSGHYGDDEQRSIAVKDAGII